MVPWLILIDLENPVPVDLNHAPAEARVLIFVGKQQASIPLELVQKAQPLGERVEWIKIKQVGENAADFVLAYELGKRLVKQPTPHIAILSKDKGFDALAQHVSQGSRKCRRIESLEELTPKQPLESDTAAQVVAPPSATHKFTELLKEHPNSRPSSRKALEKHIASHLKLSEAAALPIAEELLQTGVIKELGTGKLSYPRWSTDPIKKV